MTTSPSFASDPVRYSIGFAVSHDGQHVLLLQKGRPDYLAGRWSGVGGHVEPGETACEAMSREAQEEADLDGLDWRHIGVVERAAGPDRPGAHIEVFAAFADLRRARTLTDEPVQAFTWEQAQSLSLNDATAEVWERVRAFSISPRPRARRPSGP